MAISDSQSYSGLQDDELATPLVGKLYFDNDLPYATFAPSDIDSTLSDFSYGEALISSQVQRNLLFDFSGMNNIKNLIAYPKARPEDIFLAQKAYGSSFHALNSSITNVYSSQFTYIRCNIFNNPFLGYGSDLAQYDTSYTQTKGGMS